MSTDFQGSDFLNWPGSIDYRPRRIYRPTSLLDLVQFLESVNENDRRVRAIGSSWSLSDVEVSNDYLISGAGWGATSTWLSRVLAMSQGSEVWGAISATGLIVPPESPVLTAALNQQTLAGSQRLVHAEAGISLVDLYTILDNPGGTSRDRWALPTMGGSAGQTLAGAISTSVHGGDFGQPPFPAMVRAIDVVMADGQRHWIERDDQPITSPEGIAAAFAADPVPPIVRYDTTEFLAVLVSFGSMGVIYSLVIEVVEQYALSQQTGWWNWNDIRPLLADRTLLSSSGNPPFPGIPVNAHPTSATDAAGVVWDTGNPTAYGLEVIINPYRLSCDYFHDTSPNRQVLLVCRAMAPIPDPIDGPKPPGPNQLAELEALNDFKANDGNATSIPYDVYEIITASSARASSSSFFTAHTITDTYSYSPAQPCQPPGGPLLSIEVVLPTRNGYELAFVDALLLAFDSIIANNVGDKFAGIFSIRYCQASDAYLSMQGFGPEHLDNGLVCNIEIGCLHNVDTFGNRIYGDEDIVGLKDGAKCESSSRKHMVAFEALVKQCGARLHWGQMSFTDIHDPKTYPNYPKWREIRSSHSENGSIRLFDSDFTTRYQVSASNTSTHWSVVANSLLPGAATVAQADAAAEAAIMPPTVFLSAQNCIEIVAAGSDGQVCWTRQPAPGEDLLHWSWVQRPDSRIDNCQSGNVTFSPQFGGRLAIGVNSDSHPEVFAWCESDTGIYHSWRNLQDNTWNNWTQLKGDFGFAGAPDAALASDGTLVVVATTSRRNVVRWTSQNSFLGVVGWNDWADLPGPIDDLAAGSPSVALGGDGLLHTFITTQNGFVRESKQLSPAGSSAWGDWTGIGQQTADTLGNLLDGQHLVLTGDFTGAGHQQVLLYSSGDGNWWLADIEGGTQNWTFAGNTAGFGNLLDGQHKFWTGHFNGGGPAQVMFYYAGDGNWWLADMQGGELSWSLFDNTAGFGNLLDGQHEFFTGDLIGEGLDLMLFYYAGDGNWWLRAGSILGFGWVQVGNTAGFGNLLDGQHPFWSGDFTGAGHQQVLFYYSGDSHWWLGDIEDGSLNWTLISDSSGFGNLLDGQHKFWTGHFNGGGPAQVMFYYAGDGNWWLADMQGGELSWSLFDNTAGFGNLLDGQHEFFTGDLIGEGLDLMLFYYAGDGNWWLRAGSILGFGWVQVGNTAGFGNLLDGQHPFWSGDFTGAGHQQVLFYYSGDSHWWLGDIEDGSLNWTLISDSSGFIASPPGIGMNSDGTLELFAVKTSGQLCHIRQSTDLTWNISSWEPVIDGDPFTISSADRPSVTAVGGIVHVAAGAADGTIVRYQQQGSGYLQQPLGGPFTSPPVITKDSNGLPAIFAKFASDIVQQWLPQPTRPNLFAYDPRAGVAELYSIDAVGNISLMQSNSSWLTGYWLGAAGRFAGTDVPAVLVYDSSAATASFYTFDDQGNAAQLNGFGWGNTWSRVACGNFTGGPFEDLVFYDPVNGVGEFYITDGRGNMSLLKQYSDWRNSWSALVAANFTGGMFDDLLLYDPEAGEGELYRTDGHGNIALVKSYTGWRKNWTHILSGRFTDSRYADLLFYDEIGGYAELYSSDGQGNLTLQSTFAGWQGWTFAVAGQFTGRPFSDLFLYNPVSGTGELHTADGSGNLGLIQTYANWPHYWGIVLPLTGRL